MNSFDDVYKQKLYEYLENEYQLAKSEADYSVQNAALNDVLQKYRKVDLYERSKYGEY